MNYKKEIEKYNKEVARLKAISVAEAKEAWSEIIKAVDARNNAIDEEVVKFNESPCSVCSNKSFVLKYRNVVGKVEGKISGSFSLFGGSIFGYVDGETKTLPVLSCRSCENERIIKIAEHERYEDCLKGQYPRDYTYQGSGTFYPAKKWLQSKGLEVAILLEDHIYLSHWEEEDMSVKNRGPEWLKKAGLDYKYQQPEKPSRWKCFWN